MAAELRAFSVTIAPGVVPAAPSIVALTMPARIVSHVRIRIPPGPLGSVGFALGSSGVPVLPYNPGAWIIGDDEVIDLDVSGQISSGAWQLIGYNTGLNPHTIQVQFSLELPSGQLLPTALVPLDLEA